MIVATVYRCCQWGFPECQTRIFHRGTLSVHDWNGYMRQVQGLREDALAGRLTVEELRAQYDTVSARRMKTK